MKKIVKKKSSRVNRFLSMYVGLGIIILVIIGITFLFTTQHKSQQETSFIKNSSDLIATPTKGSNALMVTIIPTDNTNVTKNYTHKVDTGFPSFSIQYPSSWTLKNDIQDLGYTHSSKIILTKGEYEIRIYQAPMGGKWCVFEGQVPIGGYADFRNTPYTHIDSGIGDLRRIKSSVTYYSEHKDMMSFYFCHKNIDKQNEFTDYSAPTGIGQITYTLPIEYNETTLQEMDTIIKSLH